MFMFFIGYLYFLFSFKYFFDVGIFFKVFIECVTTLFLFYVSVFWPRGMWGLCSPTRDQILTLGNGR